MSSDDGYIIREMSGPYNTLGFVLQYWIGDSESCEIRGTDPVFETLEDAVRDYAENTGKYQSEYGLSFALKPPPKIKLEKYSLRNGVKVCPGCGRLINGSIPLEDCGHNMHGIVISPLAVMYVLEHFEL